jgi:uncharacterized protein
MMTRGAPLPITPTFPGVYLGEIPGGSHTITPVATSIAAFVGRAPMGPLDEALTVFSFGDFTLLYGGLSLDYPMSYAVQHFFENGGSEAGIARLFDDGDFLQPQTYLGDPLKNTGIYLLNTVPMFNLLCIPPDQRIFDDVPLAQQDLDPNVRNAAAHYCTDKHAIYIVDPPAAWDQLAADGRIADIKLEDLGITGETEAGIEAGRNAAVYFPRFIGEDILMKGRPAMFAPSGAIAGIIAATDVRHGVWTSPAGIDAGVTGVSSLNVTLTDQQQGVLNPLGINCLRTFPGIGTVVWGARTLRGAEQFEDDYKYLPVRRLALFIEDSVYRGTQWAAFAPNDESLWSSLRLCVNSFLADLSRQGAFYNYLVTCDATTTTPTDIANGIVNILIGIAPVRPAEFVMIQIRQTAMTAAS